MSAGNRPFCNARTMGKWVAGEHAALRAEWVTWSIDTFGNPFIIDTRDDTFQAVYMNGDNMPIGTGGGQ